MINYPPLQHHSANQIAARPQQCQMECLIAWGSPVLTNKGGVQDSYIRAKVCLRPGLWAVCTKAGSKHQCVEVKDCVGVISLYTWTGAYVHTCELF